MRRARSLLFGLLLIPTLAAATTVEINKLEGIFGRHDVYRWAIEDLKVGDTLVLGDGRREEIKELVGQGTQTKIVAIANGHLLRLPKYRPDFDGENSVDQFYHGIIHLKALAPAARHLQIYAYLEHEYVEVERVEHPVALRHFHRDWYAREAGDALKYFTLAELQLAHAKLLEFARLTSHVVYVGDQTDENIVYSPTTGWLFTDVHDQHLLYREVGWKKHIFTHLTSDNLLRELTEVIQNQRKKDGLVTCQDALETEDILRIIRERSY